MNKIIDGVVEVAENATEAIEKISQGEALNEAKAKGKTQTMIKGMAAKLAKCKKVTIKVPIDKQNPKDTTVEVQINGYVFQIKRGVEVEVPLPVKKLLERGEYI